MIKKGWINRTMTVVCLVVTPAMRKLRWYLASDWNRLLSVGC